MGTQVTGVYNASKQDLAITTVAAGAITAAANNCLIWVGSNDGHRQADKYRRLQQCLEAIEEAGVPNVQSAKVAFGAPKSAVILAATAQTVTEQEVYITYHANFFQVASAHHSGILRRHVAILRERLLEDVMKVA